LDLRGRRGGPGNVRLILRGSIRQGNQGRSTLGEGKRRERFPQEGTKKKARRHIGNLSHEATIAAAKGSQDEGPSSPRPKRPKKFIVRRQERDADDLDRCANTDLLRNSEAGGKKKSDLSSLREEGEDSRQKSVIVTVLVRWIKRDRSTSE